MPIPTPAPAPVRPILAFLAATLALRLFSLWATGFCDDEAYVVVISRAPALSYFDHPPLHQWALCAWTALFGEGRAARLPFLGFSLVTAYALFGLARRLFSESAAWWTLFAFSASAYFLVYPDGYIMPDPPLLAFVALGVWAVAEILYGPKAGQTKLWLAAGLAFGLAGLSKYSAIFAPLGLFGFLSFSPAHRRLLRHPAAWAGAGLGLVCLAPALIWNAQHQWVSLAFQTGRAARGFNLDAKAIGGVFEALGAQIGSLSPWIALPILGGLASVWRRGADRPERFLVWQAAPALLLFLALPLLGQRPIAHWFNSGWLFAFPLAGHWLAQRSPRFLARFLPVSAGLSGLAFVLYFIVVLGGPLLPAAAHDPTRAMFDWPAAPLRQAYAQAGADFVLIDNWRVGGRVGVALGRRVPVCAMGSDPRGFAFACDAHKHIGETALIVGASESESSRFFREVAPAGELTVGRRGIAERKLTLETGRGLIEAPPLPYGR